MRIQGAARGLAGCKPAIGADISTSRVDDDRRLRDRRSTPRHHRTATAAGRCSRRSERVSSSTTRGRCGRHDESKAAGGDAGRLHAAVFPEQAPITSVRCWVKSRDFDQLGEARPERSGREQTTVLVVAQGAPAASIDE